MQITRLRVYRKNEMVELYTDGAQRDGCYNIVKRVPQYSVKLEPHVKVSR